MNDEPNDDFDELEGNTPNDEDRWEDEGGAGVREPRRPVRPSGTEGAAVEAKPELVAAWYY